MNYIGLQKKLRLKILKLHYNAKAGHIGSSLSVIDILIAVYFQLKHEGDSVILSKGHAASALYSCLNELGLISNSDLDYYYKDNTKLPAHPPVNLFEDIPFATGSLGHGFPLACGIAKANQIRQNSKNVFVVLSDGDSNEGTMWESANFAVSNKLSNLYVIIDKNNIQGFNITIDAIGDTAKAEVFRQIGFDVYEVDGHNIHDIINVVEVSYKEENNRPKMIVANTNKGKGVGFMEDTIDWHYWPMNEAQYKEAIDDINKYYNA